VTALSDTIADLWRGLDDTPDDLGRLLVIADAYREEDMDTWADCLEWCYRNGRKPEVFGRRFDWYTGSYWKRHCSPSILPNVVSKFLAMPQNGNLFTEYRNGHKTPSLAYQFLCRMWDEIGGVKEDV